MKKIAPNEEFNLSGHIFTYSLNNEGGLVFKKVKYVKGKPKFQPPTVEEVITYFRSKGYKEESARKFHEYYSNGTPPWTDGGGKPVRSWTQKALSVWFKPENKEPIKEKDPDNKFLF